MSSPSSGQVKVVKLHQTTGAHIHVHASTHKHMSRCTDTHTGSCVSGRGDIRLCVLARMHLQTCGSEQVQRTQANRQTHTCTLKSCWQARDVVTHWRCIAGCCQRRPGVKGAGKEAPPPGERQVHEWGGRMGTRRGCESMTVSTRAAVGITSTTLLHML